MRDTDTHRPVGPNSLKKQTEYKYLKPAVPSAAGDTVSILILDPTAAPLLFFPSLFLQLACAASANGASALPSRPTQDCRELYSLSTCTHTLAFLANTQSSSTRLKGGCSLSLLLKFSNKKKKKTQLNCFASKQLINVCG